MQEITTVVILFVKHTIERFVTNKLWAVCAINVAVTQS
jgi:hypothetical protein